MGPHPDTSAGGRPRWGRGIALIAVAAALVAAAGVASARMITNRIGPTLCQTTGGGKFVDVPGFPGERIDRRLLNDIRYLRKRYSIFITDGYSMDAVHSINGEHPRGLALDIVPDKAEGGTWEDIDRLARWAEPKQNQPRAPFRWVGYDGDSGHGRGHHLHLSWGHSESRPGVPARLVQTIRCPGPRGGNPQPPTTPEPPLPPDEGADEPTGPASGGATVRGDRDRDRDRHRRDRHRDRARDADSGGISNPGNGGIRGKLGLAPPMVESGGVGLGG